MKVGYLGPKESTYSYMAACVYFDKRRSPSFVPITPQPDICVAVRRGEVDRGVVAVENVIDGAVFSVIQAMRGEHSRGVRVCGEVTIPIEIFPLRAEYRNELPACVVSHPTALGQCSRYVEQLERQGVKKEFASSTGEAATRAKKDPTILALGPSILTKTMGLVSVFNCSVADDPNNSTRFWIIAKNVSCKPTGKDKTSLLVSLTRDEPGGVYRSLGPFAEQKINLCFLFPIPIPGTQWEYTFLLELEAHEDDPSMEKALDKLVNNSGVLSTHVLGSYPNSLMYSP